MSAFVIIKTALSPTLVDFARPREAAAPARPHDNTPAAVVRVSEAARQLNTEARDLDKAEAAPRPDLGPRRTDELTPDQKREVDQLRERDREVRAHEAAHKAAAGGLGASSPSYEMETGPDGRQYAVGGHVDIDVSQGSSPDETIAKAARIRAAAHAPAEPSGQDLAVAAQASQMEAQARMEKAKDDMEGEGSRAEAGNMSFRKGGVDGGHAHPDTGCGVCTAGIKAYGK